jgi:hypothetical protein
MKLTEKQQLKERSYLLKYWSGKKTYSKYLFAALHKGSIKPRKGYWSKLLGNIKTQISTNLFNI